MFTRIGISLIVNAQVCMAPTTYRTVITYSSEEVLAVLFCYEKRVLPRSVCVTIEFWSGKYAFSMVGGTIAYIKHA